MDIRERQTRYLAIVKWARRRYTEPCGRLVLSVGNMPSRFSRIEIMAWNRYMDR